MITYESIKENKDIKTYIECADSSLKALGYTEHSYAHVGRVANVAEYILKTLDFSEHETELAKIAAHLHDIGNLVNRVDHSQSGAIMAFRILSALGMPSEDVATITTAIGNHDEGTGVAVNPVAAALIIADKTDVRRTRVRNADELTFDIHDRVNYSVEKAEVEIDKESSLLYLKLTIDTKYGSIMDYFEIFMERMLLCRKAAEALKLQFKLIINDHQLL